MLESIILVFKIIGFFIYHTVYDRLRRIWLNIRPIHRKNLDLSDKTVMVIGAAHGTGRQMTLQLLALPRDHRPKLLLLIDQAGLDEFSKNQKYLTVQVECYHVDISRIDDVRQIVRNVANVDVVIFNAGVARKKTFDEISMDQYMLTMEINFHSNVGITKEILSYHNCSHLVYIGSSLSYVATETATEYCASKYALRGFVEGLQIEMANNSRAVNISMVCPHFIQSSAEAGDQAGQEKDYKRVADAVLKCLYYKELDIVLIGFQANFIYFLNLLIGPKNLAQL